MLVICHLRLTFKIVELPLLYILALKIWEIGLLYELVDFLSRI